MIGNKNPLVSFIIPCYNVEPYIEECIKSIQSQNYKNIEIIPVNDGSPDKTLDILNFLASEDSRIRVINKDNGGVSSARNIGIEAASGEYIAFVDGDDYIAEDYAEYMLSMIRSCDAEMALSVNCYVRQGENQVPNESTSCYTPENATALLLGPRVTVGCWNKIFKRSLLVENDLKFSTTQFYGEGLLFITSATQLSKRIAVGNRKVYYYRRNNYSSACTKFKIENFYNGSKSIDIIEDNLKTRSSNVLKMLGWHRCQFKMGTVVRMVEAGVVSKYADYYKECLSYVRKHTFNCLFIKGVSLYKKSLLVGCMISPSLMASLDNMRRKRIENNSIVTLDTNIDNSSISSNSSKI